MSISPRSMFGRKVIYTDTEFIKRSNVVDVLEGVYNQHQANSADIEYLYNYYRGKQPILNRVKEIRPEINNMCIENRANEIVSFKVGYLMGEPLVYVSRDKANENNEGIALLNEYMFMEDKASKDKELAEWFYIAGTAFRMVLPSFGADEGEAPFNVYTLDPRHTMVVYHSGLGNRPVMGVKFIELENHSTIASVYTDSHYFEIKDGFITKDERHSLGMVPIVEYPANSARLGAFEVVLPLLDALNEVMSNRLDGLEQFIQSLLVLKGVDLDDGDLAKIKEMGGLKLPVDGDAKYLIQDLNQISTQKLTDYINRAILSICSLPVQGQGKSTSDTASAVIMRDGWYPAETSAKATELAFRKSEKQALRLVFKITNTLRNLNLKLSAVDVRFTRRNFENIQEKSQVLSTMLANDKIHPLLAFTHCGMFSDPQVAYAESMAYFEKREKELELELAGLNPEV